MTGRMQREAALNHAFKGLIQNETLNSIYVNQKGSIPD